MSNIVTHSQRELQIGSMLQSFDQMLEDPNSNVDAIMELALRIFGLYHHLSYQNEQSHHRRQGPQLVSSQEGYTGTFNTAKELVPTTLSSGLQLAAAVIQILPGPFGYTAETATAMGGRLSAASQGLGMFIKPAEQSSQSARAIHQFAIDRLKNLQNDGTQTMNSSREARLRFINELRTVMQSIHQARMGTSS